MAAAAAPASMGRQAFDAFCLSPRQAHAAPVGRDQLRALGVDNLQTPLIMDRAYEGNETRYLVRSLGFEPVVPPLQTRRDPWPYDTELSKRRNEIARLFGRPAMPAACQHGATHVAARGDADENRG